MATKLEEQSSPKLVTYPEKEKQQLQQQQQKPTQTFLNIMEIRLQKTQLTYADCNQDSCDLSGKGRQ